MALKKDLVFTCIFDAPRDLVFKARTEAEHLKRWWGAAWIRESRLRSGSAAGGAIRIAMRGPEGTIYPMTGIYREVVEPERLVFTSAALDEKGNPLFEVLNMVTFAEHGGKTERGWSQSLDRLVNFIPGGKTL